MRRIVKNTENSTDDVENEPRDNEEYIRKDRYARHAVSLIARASMQIGLDWANIHVAAVAPIARKYS